MKYLITDTPYNQVEFIPGAYCSLIKRWRDSKSSEWKNSVTIFTPVEKELLYDLLGKPIRGELK